MTREQRLEKLLSDAWDVFMEAYLFDTPPDQIKRRRAFLTLDKQLRAEGIVPGPQLKHVP